MTKQNQNHSAPKFRTPYTEHLRVPKMFARPSRTKQEFKEECDPNRIVQNFMRTGNLELIQKSKGQYLDLTQLPVTYHEALQLVVDSTNAFQTLPANIRDMFGNDVNAFMLATQDDPEGVYKELMKAGKASQNPPSSPTPAESAPPSSPPKATPAPSEAVASKND